MEPEHITWYCPRCQKVLGNDPSLDSLSTVSQFAQPVRVGLLHGVRLHNSGGIGPWVSSCMYCGLRYLASESSFSFDYKGLLAELGWREFIKWSLAQNSGLVSYTLLPQASLSDEDNPGGVAFSRYILAQRTTGEVVVDVGCGPLTWPSYFPKDWRNKTAVGIDPFESRFAGRFVNGTGEFIPLKNASVDNVLAATSLDHTLDIRKTLKEAARILRLGGRLIIWDHARPPRLNWFSLKSLWDELYLRAHDLKHNISEWGTNGYRKVRVYDNLVVVPIPFGFSDPFHQKASQKNSWSKKLSRILTKTGFQNVDEDSNFGFSCWEKVR